MACLLPKNAIVDGKCVLSKGYKPCRNSTDGSCVHARTLCTRFMELRERGSTDGVCTWKKVTDTSIRRDSRVADIRKGDYVNRYEKLPFSDPSAVERLQFGKSDGRVEESLRAFLSYKKTVYDEQQQSSGRNPGLLGRKLAIERVIGSQLGIN